jgi:hypothetical protein
MQRPSRRLARFRYHVAFAGNCSRRRTDAREMPGPDVMTVRPPPATLVWSHLGSAGQPPSARPADRMSWRGSLGIFLLIAAIAGLAGAGATAVLLRVF